MFRKSLLWDELTSLTKRQTCSLLLNPLTGTQLLDSCGALTHISHFNDRSTTSFVISLDVFRSVHPSDCTFKRNSHSCRGEGSRLHIYNGRRCLIKPSQPWYLGRHSLRFCSAYQRWCRLNPILNHLPRSRLVATIAQA